MFSILRNIQMCLYIGQEIALEIVIKKILRSTCIEGADYNSEGFLIVSHIE